MNLVESDPVLHFCAPPFEAKPRVPREWFPVFTYAWLVTILACLTYSEDGETGVCEREDYHGKCELGDVCLVGGLTLSEDLTILQSSLQELEAYPNGIM